MFKALFCWLYLIIGMDTSTPKEVYSNPMEGYIWQTSTVHLKNYEPINQGIFTEEEDSKEDSDDSDNEFNPAELLRILIKNTGIIFDGKLLGYSNDFGQLSSAYLPPILSPPDVYASLT